MSGCPQCAAPASASPGDAGTCGSFRCLYRHFCGEDPPAPVVARPFPWREPGQVRSIAVVRPGQVGDLLLAIPGLRALRAGFPAARITLVTQTWAEPFAARFPWIDRIIALDTGHEVRSLGGQRAAAFVREARRDGYDLVLQIQGDSPYHSRLALAAGGRATAGFCADAEIGSRFDLLLSMSTTEPEILRVMRLVHHLGAAAAGVQVGLPIMAQDEEELGRIRGLPEALAHRPAIAIHPGARAPARRWPVERFRRLAELLLRRVGALLLVVGGAEEAPITRELCDNANGMALDLAGRLSLGGLAALLARVDLFIGNDSGPAQLAMAVAPRSLRIFGPANQRRWAPLDHARHRSIHRPVECSPCDHFECPIDHRCLEGITVEEVLSEAESLLMGA